MRESIEEYILTLQEEIDRCNKWVEDNPNGDFCKIESTCARVVALYEVKCDLEARLEEDKTDESVVHTHNHVSKFDFEEEYEEI